MQGAVLACAAPTAPPLATGGGGGGGGRGVAMVRRALLAACVTCALCKRLLRDATTISECLHTFCRKCIFDKFTDDEEVSCCPICKIDLGCAPLEKLRGDHNLQDLRAKIFPFKRRKVESHEVMPPIALPARRKERSLSSLAIHSPRMSIQKCLTRTRTRAIARRASALRGFGSINGSAKKEEGFAKSAEDSSSLKSMSKTIQTRRNRSALMSIEDTEDGRESCKAKKAGTWKPLHCLVEAATGGKSLKSSPDKPAASEEKYGDHGVCAHADPTKVREHLLKSGVQEEKTNRNILHPIKVKKKKMKAKLAQQKRRLRAIWFSLIAAFDQKGDPSLPQIPSRFLRIKDVDLPASFIQKYIVQKLNLSSESEVEMLCRGHPVSPGMPLHNLADQWLSEGPKHRVWSSVGSPGEEFVMAIVYRRRKVSSPETCDV